MKIAHAIIRLRVCLPLIIFMLISTSNAFCSNINDSESDQDKHCAQSPDTIAAILNTDQDNADQNKPTEIPLTATALQGTKQSGALFLIEKECFKYFFNDLFPFLTGNEIELLRTLTGLRTLIEKHEYYSNSARNLNFTFSNQADADAVYPYQAMGNFVTLHKTSPLYTLDSLVSYTLSGDAKICHKMLSHLKATNLKKLCLDFSVSINDLEYFPANTPNIEEILLMNFEEMSFHTFSQFEALQHFNGIYIQAADWESPKPLNIKRFMLTKKERLGRDNQSIFAKKHIENDGHTSIEYNDNTTSLETYKKINLVKFHSILILSGFIAGTVSSIEAERFTGNETINITVEGITRTIPVWPF